MTNQKLLEPVSIYRMAARDNLKGKWSNGWLAAAVFLLCNLALPNIIESLPIPVGLSSIIGIAFIVCVFAPVSFGVKHVGLAIERGRDIGGTDVFSKFKDMGRAIKYMLWSTLFVIVWALPAIAVFVVFYMLQGDHSPYVYYGGSGIVLLLAVLFLAALIPALLATIRYEMGYYLMIDNPQMTAKKALDETKPLLKNNMGKLFTLYISFIGWYLLAAVVLGIFSYVGTGFQGIQNLDSNSIPYNLSLILESGVLAIIFIYLEVSLAAFYERLIGNTLTLNSAKSKAQPTVAPAIETTEKTPVSEEISEPNTDSATSDQLTGVIREKKFILVFGIIIIAFFPLSFIPAYYFHPAIIAVGAIFGALGAWCILAYTKYRIEFDKDGFTYSNIGTPKTRYSYKDITEIDTKGMDWKIYMRGKKIRLDNSHANREVFVAMANGDFSKISEIKKEVETTNKAMRKNGIILFAVGIILYAIYFTIVINAPDTVYSEMFKWIAFGFVIAGISGMIGIGGKKNDK